MHLFEPGAIENKHITAEACVHHLWFSDQDYPRLGNFIKCNPAIKSAMDRDALIQALHNKQIDIIATDHAPHTREEKQTDYTHAPAGLPLVEYGLLSCLDHVKNKRLTLEQIVEKTAHNPALRYAVKERGFIREGYYADLVFVDMCRPTPVCDEKVLSHCAWTPFQGHQFSASIQGTWVNGTQVFNGQKTPVQPASPVRLEFNR